MAPSRSRPAKQVLALRDEPHKIALAIHAYTDRAASEHRPPDPVETCTLFKAFISSDAKYIQSIQTGAQTCGIPPTLIKQIQEGHSKAAEISKQVCDAAEHSRPTGSVRPADPIRDTLDGLRPDKSQSPFPAYDPYFMEPHLLAWRLQAPQF